VPGSISGIYPVRTSHPQRVAYGRGSCCLGLCLFRAFWTPIGAGSRVDRWDPADGPAASARSHSPAAAVPLPVALRS
jgi:hypothetical protein